MTMANVCPIVQDSNGMRRVATAADVLTDEDGTFLPSGYVLNFGADLLTAGRYAAVNGAATATELSALSHSSEATAPRSGIVTAISWNTESGDNTTVVKVWVAGGVVAAVTLSGAQGVDETLSNAVTAGQKVALEFDAGTVPDEGTYQIYVT